MLSLTKNNIFLVLILLLATLVRSYKIASFPPINSDEAAIGYNAYSLLKTGLDEHGASWPLHFKSFGDFKPGGYFYLVLPFVKLIGLNTLAVRLPNLILSILSIFFIYKLLKLLSNRSLAMFSAFLLAISPWHIHFSRGGWESCTALSFTIIAIFLFYSYILNHKSYIYLFSSVVFFVLSLYTYHSSRLITPLIIAFLFINNFKTLTSKLHLKTTIYALVLAIILALPVTLSFVYSGGTARFGGVGLLADQGPIWRANELLNQHYPLTLFYRLIHNKRVLYFISWLDNYTSHFTPDFLFLNGDQVGRSKIPFMGLFYLIELPVFVIGLLSLKKISYKNLRHLLVFLLLVSPIASSFTFQAPSALRSLPLVVPIAILSCLGLQYLSKHINHLFYFLIPIYIYSFAFYLNSYFCLYPYLYPLSWQYGFDKIVPIVEANKDKYEHIYFTNKYDQPYILYLFYSQYDPTLLHAQIKLTPPDQYGFSTVKSIDNIIFDKIDWQAIPGNSMVISSDETIPIDTNNFVNFPNGQKAFKIYTR